MRAMTLTRYLSLFLLAGILIVTSCKKESLETGFFDESILSISTYLDNNKDDYDKFWQIVQSTELYYTLNAYNPLG